MARKLMEMTAEQREKGIASKALAKSAVDLLNAASLDLSTTQETKVLERLESMPAGCRARYLRAMGGKSLRAAVSAHCSECVGWVRSEVTNCTGIACPLHPYRPFQEATK